jgi:hypothetical protein
MAISLRLATRMLFARRRCRRAGRVPGVQQGRRRRRRPGRCSACGASPALPLAAARRLPADAGRPAPHTLVPPYLTMPLMDKVLIPYQNGKPIDPAWSPLSLRPARRRAAGLGARLGAHLYPGAGFRTHRRRPAHDHLRAPAGLSQEYFGGKRTGDLMARIGSETDRINIFMSLHLLDFATDVLMIAMTTASWSRSTPGWRWSPCCRCRSSPG